MASGAAADAAEPPSAGDAMAAAGMPGGVPPGGPPAVPPAQGMA
jgi:hypothetical protein